MWHDTVAKVLSLTVVPKLDSMEPPKKINFPPDF